MHCLERGISVSGGLSTVPNGDLKQNPVLRSGSSYPSEVVFGRTEALQAIAAKVVKLAATNVPVLIEGESGTGKEVLARYIHCLSPLRNGPFVKVSCAAIPESLTESELFGYQKGAFTGANDSKPGKVELAHHGTLYLDEIAELDSPRQAKLLQVLQDGRFSRIGDQEETKVDARVICATNRDLEKEISGGGFRQDLYYRVNVFHIVLPPLRARLQDIPTIGQFLVDECSARFNRPVEPLPNDVLRWMQSYNWPGNIRELENWIIRYVLLGVDEMRAKHALAHQQFGVPRTTDAGISLKQITKQAIQEAERALILKTLEAHHWNRRRTAETLKVSYRALIYKIRQSGIPSRRPARTADKRAASELTTNSVPSSSASASPA
jgi:two-component system, NtrC family, response regulator AtoC